MVHSLNPLLVSNHLEGLPKAGIMSVYLVTLAGSLSCTCWSPLEPPWTSWIQECHGKELLSVTTCCVVLSETSPFIWTCYLPAIYHLMLLYWQSQQWIPRHSLQNTCDSYDLSLTSSFSKMMIPTFTVLPSTKLLFSRMIFFPLRKRGWENGSK